MNLGRRFTEVFGVELPIIQAPMAGASDADLAIAVSEAGGLGSLPCAMLTPDQVHSSFRNIRQRTERPINLNFFCHRSPAPDALRDAEWRALLAPYYREFGIDEATIAGGQNRMPFDDAMCDVVVELKPPVVSFHFGLPSKALLERVRASGARVISSATTVTEARWLEAEGCDAVIAQGFEAGGHRGMFLQMDPARQVGTFALVPQIADAVKIPVIATGGIGDARGVVAALTLGASAVMLGTAYLRCPEARPSAALRKALESAQDDSTVVTNVITGRPARGIVNRVIREIGPLNVAAPEFPRAADALAPIRSRAESTSSGDFSPLWAGQAAAMAQEIPAYALTKMLAVQAVQLLRQLAASI